MESTYYPEVNSNFHHNKFDQIRINGIFMRDSLL